MCLVRVGGREACEAAGKERTAQEWIHMAEQARDAGTLSLLLTGGEVMLRRDFCEIYEEVSRMGFLLTVYTNATMVTDEIMDVLKKCPPHRIGVTLYGASNATYEKVSGCADGFDRFCMGARRLSALPSRFEVRTTIIRDNCKDLEAMKAFTAREFGAGKKPTINRIVSERVRGGVMWPVNCRLSPEENVELIHGELVELARKKRDGAAAFPKGMRKFPMPHCSFGNGEGALFEHCGAGEDSYIISWKGKMYACELLQQGCTNPFQTGFEEAWKELPKQYPANHPIEVCNSCEYAALCEACPAIRLSETGDWFGIPEYACKEARHLHRLLLSLNAI